VLQHTTFSHPTSSLAKISRCSPRSRWMAGLRSDCILCWPFGQYSSVMSRDCVLADKFIKVSNIGLIVRELVFKISKICAHDPPTSKTDGRTDRQTDRQTTCDLKTALCTIVHREIHSQRTDTDAGVLKVVVSNFIVRVVLSVWM